MRGRMLSGMAHDRRVEDSLTNGDRLGNHGPMSLTSHLSRPSSSSHSPTLPLSHASSFPASWLAGPCFGQGLAWVGVREPLVHATP